MANGKRLLFFDLLRIGSVALIVFHHVAMITGLTPFSNLIYGAAGVALLIFVSGAVLEYSRPQLDTVAQISEFYVKRMFRLYPAYWMSLLLGLACAPALLTTMPLSAYPVEFVGFAAFAGNWGGFINPVGWFIGLIVVLYFLYPFFSASIRKYPWLMLALFAVLEVSLRYFMMLPQVQGLSIAPQRWFPACNFLEFGLGIWVVQQGLYPKWTHSTGTITALAEVSFYVFLSHYVLLGLYSLSPAVYLAAVALFSWLFMLGDQRIQPFLKRVAGIGCTVRDNTS